MGVFKNFLLKQALKAKMKDAPEAERERMLELIERNPDLFEKIGKEVQKRVKAGQSEMAATMVVMRQFQSQLQKTAK